MASDRNPENGAGLPVVGIVEVSSAGSLGPCPCKRYASQNRSVEDVEGVIAGFVAQPNEAMATSMRRGRDRT